MIKLKNTLMFLSVNFLAVSAFAQETSHQGNSGLGLAAAIAIGVAALGGAIGQGLAASAALNGISRNPAAQGKLFVPMIIGLALIESLVIYALVIAFQLVGKI